MQRVSVGRVVCGVRVSGGGRASSSSSSVMRPRVSGATACGIIVYTAAVYVRTTHTSLDTRVDHSLPAALSGSAGNTREGVEIPYNQ